jgi:hypothetical protein
MNVLDRLRRMIRGSEPTIVDYETYEATGTDGPMAAAPVAEKNPSVLRRVGPESYPAYPQMGPGVYKIQQSYDSLLETVKDLREALDGQQKRQDELLTRLSALPLAAEALPQTTKMQSDMLKMINERLAMHADQQRKVGDVLNTIGKAKPGAAAVSAEALQGLRDQIEMGNEIDRQLVDSFNRFSMMIDRLHMANNHAVEALQQVRDSYAHTAMQMHEWIEKSRHRNRWILGLSLVMSFTALTAVGVLFYVLAQPAAKVLGTP